MFTSSSYPTTTRPETPTLLKSSSSVSPTSFKTWTTIKSSTMVTTFEPTIFPTATDYTIGSTKTTGILSDIKEFSTFVNLTS